MNRTKLLVLALMLPWSMAAEYSQSMLIPSKLYFCKNDTRENTKTSQFMQVLATTFLSIDISLFIIYKPGCYYMKIASVLGDY